MVRNILALLAWFIPCGASAEDCVPNTPPLESIGLFDSNTWICPVRNNTTPAEPGSDTSAPREYWMVVLDKRACPVFGFQVSTWGTGWDPTPIWSKDQTFVFLIDAQRRQGITARGGTVPASGDSCRTEVDRIERSRAPLVREGLGIPDSTVLFRPPQEGEPTEEGKTLLFADGADPWVRVSVEATEAQRVITWSEVLEKRGTPAAVGVDFSLHDESCGGGTSRGPACEFDSDCAICHDGSSCGTLSTLKKVIDKGEACMIPDAAECEEAMPRCCGGHCTLRPY
jgi:hypothetical protein